MKIFFAIKSLHSTGGMERMTIIIANELLKRGYDVGIIGFANEGKPFFEILPKVNIFYLHDSKDKRMSLIRDASRRKLLKKIYQTEKPDVVIFVGSGRSMLNIPAAKGFTTITWEHFNANVNWHLLHPLSKLLAAKYCDKIVTLTHQDVKNYEQKYGAKNAVCIPNPITVNVLQKSTLTDKRVLAVGRLMPQKGFDLLIDAWSKVENRKNGWKLRIVGKGRMENELIEKINHYSLQDSVEMVPFSNNVVEHYLQSSIFVMSSRFEGLPLVMIEAMATGLPIVSFDCETGPSDIIENNVTGILVPPFDVNKLAYELDNLMNDEKKRHLFAKNGIERSKLFDTERIISKWGKLFDELKENKK